LRKLKVVDMPATHSSDLNVEAGHVGVQHWDDSVHIKHVPNGQTDKESSIRRMRRRIFAQVPVVQHMISGESLQASSAWPNLSVLLLLPWKHTVGKAAREGLKTSDEHTHIHILLYNNRTGHT
jgi:hypothetical protein